LHLDASDLPPLVSPPLPMDNRLYLHSLQGLVTRDLLVNFLKLLKAFSDCNCGEQYEKIADQCYDSKIAESKERKINGRNKSFCKQRALQKKKKLTMQPLQ
jgi:hypothetical protein